MNDQENDILAWDAKESMCLLCAAVAFLIGIFASGSPLGILYALPGALLFIIPVIYSRKKKYEEKANVAERAERILDKDQSPYSRMYMNSVDREIRSLVYKIQDAYMFSFSLEQIERVLISSNPVYTLYRAIPTAIPSVEDFKFKLHQRSIQVLKTFSLPDEEEKESEQLIIFEISQIDEEVMLAIIERQNQLLPPEMQFLRNSINYDSVCLNFLMDAADILENKTLENAVFDYMIKQGYTTRTAVEAAKSHLDQE